MIHKLWILLLTIIMGCLISFPAAADAPVQARQAPPNRGLEAITKAAKANRHLFIFFFRQKDAETQALGPVLDSAVASLGPRAESISIPITDPAEAGIVAKFGVSDAPMPLVLVLAPNGAVTASFPGNFTKEQLLGGIGTPAMAQLLGALQQGKLVFLCVQNGKTHLNTEAMSGVFAFKADQRYAAATEVLTLDLGIPQESPFLAKLGLNAPVDEALTVFLAPPGTIIGSFKGATDKNQLIATLTKASKGCCAGGCQPGQCSVGK